VQVHLYQQYSTQVHASPGLAQTGLLLFTIILGCLLACMLGLIRFPHFPSYAIPQQEALVETLSGTSFNC